MQGQQPQQPFQLPPGSVRCDVVPANHPALPPRPTVPARPGQQWMPIFHPQENKHMWLEVPVAQQQQPPPPRPLLAVPYGAPPPQSPQQPQQQAWQPLPQTPLGPGSQQPPPAGPGAPLPGSQAMAGSANPSPAATPGRGGGGPVAPPPAPLQQQQQPPSPLRGAGGALPSPQNVSRRPPFTSASDPSAPAGLAGGAPLFVVPAANTNNTNGAPTAAAADDGAGGGNASDGALLARELAVARGDIVEEPCLSRGPLNTNARACAERSGLMPPLTQAQLALAQNNPAGPPSPLDERGVRYLSAAAEAQVCALLHALARVSLQRLDVGRAFEGARRTDDPRQPLLALESRERLAARRKQAQHQAEQASLADSRKRLTEQERTAAKAAKAQQQLQAQRVQTAAALEKLGLGRRAFFGGLGGAAGRAGGPKAAAKKAAAVEAAGKAAAGGGAAVVKSEGGGGGPLKQQRQAEAGGEEVEEEEQQRQEQEEDEGGAMDEDGGGAAAAPAARRPAAASAKGLTLQQQMIQARGHRAVGEGGGAGAAAARGRGGGGAGGGGGGWESGPRQPRDLTLRDLVAVMERDPIFCRSPELYRLYLELAAEVARQDAEAGDFGGAGGLGGGGGGGGAVGGARSGLPAAGALAVGAPPGK